MAVVDTKPAVNDVIQSRLACLCNEQIALNVFHHKVVSITTLGATLSEIAEALDDSMSVPYKAWLPVTAEWYGTGCRILNPPISLEATFTGNAGIGGGGALVAPLQSTGIIHERTNFGGSGFRGRLYIPFIGTSNIAANGHLTVGAVALLNDITVALDITFTVVGVTGSTTMQLVLRHTQAHGVPVVGLSTTPVTALAAGILIATQRRRGQYGRANRPPF